MHEALDLDCLDEANIMLDAVAFVNRGVDVDLERPITAAERDAVLS